MNSVLQEEVDSLFLVEGKVIFKDQKKKKQRVKQSICWQPLMFLLKVIKNVYFGKFIT